VLLQIGKQLLMRVPGSFLLWSYSKGDKEENSCIKAEIIVVLVGVC
jgi:hypothetical protein